MTHPNAIDALLPQTQCGLCGYAGCMPYAQAIANHQETIDKCLPGGIDTLQALADLTQQNAEPYLQAMQQKAVPPQLAYIQEDHCIGCTKCIQACPVDAIVGSAKYMHTILNDVCTGCGLCLPPCPVDCIDLIQLTQTLSDSEKRQKADQARTRFHKHQSRLHTLQKTKKIASATVQPNDIEAIMRRVRGRRC